MTLLAIDVGNTNSVFAIHDGDRTLGEWRCATDRARTADEYYVWLSQLMAHADIPARADRVILSSVVPQVVFNLDILARRYFDAAPLVVGRDSAGVPVRVDPDVNVGADRLVNTVGAFDRYGGDLVIVDFGTATTFDVVGQDGAYEGGIIAPGVNLSLKALTEAAAALPMVAIEDPGRVVGTNTRACMQSGIYHGYIAMIEGLTARIAAERGRPMTVIGTGGLSTLFASGTDAIHRIDPDLTIHGLVLIDRQNRSTAA